ncbi:hypothetical protein [Pseudoxanthomonas taiwanensis]|nr:hypothetical protein [Pseudoxanthomonas taiwanensis]
MRGMRLLRAYGTALSLLLGALLGAGLSWLGPAAGTPREAASPGLLWVAAGFLALAAGAGARATWRCIHAARRRPGPERDGHVADSCGCADGGRGGGTWCR